MRGNGIKSVGWVACVDCVKEGTSLQNIDIEHGAECTSCGRKWFRGQSLDGQWLAPALWAMKEAGS